MAIEIKVPAVGESVTEGTVSRWLKQDGEAVRADEPLFELETEKATTEVAAPVAGTLRIEVPEGRTVPIGTVVGRIEDGAKVQKPATAEEQPARAGKGVKGTPDGLAKPAPAPPEKAPAKAA